MGLIMYTKIVRKITNKISNLMNGHCGGTTGHCN